MGMPILSRLYGPAAVAVATLATAVSSAQIPSGNMAAAHAPFLMYAAHPSLPLPPLFSPCCQFDPNLVTPAIGACVPDCSTSCSLKWVSMVQKQGLNSGHPMQSPLLLHSGACSGPGLPSAFSAVIHSRILPAGGVSSSGAFPRRAFASFSFSQPFAASGYSHFWQCSSDAALLFQSGVFDVKQAQIDEKGHGKEVATVVLLGWLGSKQKHLKKYADWYNARGINAVTFVLPMSDLLCVKVGKTEEQIDQLAHHLATWLKEEGDGKEKHLFFHTFSNTGWLTYGVVLERLLQKDEKLLNRITGCVVDSAPVADPDPQVWASGFSAAFLGKRSIATQQFEAINKTKGEKMEVQPHIAEAALLTMLEKFFSFFLQIPAIKKRLTEVVGVLSNQQPSCPQLYIYSNADRVIPAKSVESFIDEQKKAGRLVKSCNLETSPHVDHFRTFPDIYGSHLNNFIKDCMPQA